MSFDREMDELILQYLQEIKPDKYASLTLEEIRNKPRYDRVWVWWKALAHYSMQNTYKRLEDVPDMPDGSYVTIMNKTNIYYERRNGEWIKQHEMKYEDCKKIYG